MLLVHIGIASMRQLQCVHTTYVHSIITIKQVFHKLFNFFFMFQFNEHVEMNKLLCSLACTWITIIDSQFYILDVSLECNANLVVARLFVVASNNTHVNIHISRKYEGLLYCLSHHLHPYFVYASSK